jgi:hypothetical protein
MVAMFLVFRRRGTKHFKNGSPHVRGGCFDLRAVGRHLECAKFLDLVNSSSKTANSTIDLTDGLEHARQRMAWA